MPYPKKYLHISSARDLEGLDRLLYRFFEFLPGLLSWGTIALMFFFSWWRPVWVAIFIIAFDLYWLIKTVFLSFHLRANWNRVRHNLEIDWEERLKALKWDHIWQLVILPTADEPKEVIRESIESLTMARWPKEKMMVVLALEDKGEEAEALGLEMRQLFQNTFGVFLVTLHPQHLAGEMRGKGSNETWAARHAKIIIDEQKIPYESIIVSSFDIDTKVFPQFFLCLAWHFLTAEKPYRSSFQPVPLYNNNIWEAGAVSRVVASSGTFWQMMQQERPERLTTFSSHSVSFKSLVEVDFWQTNIVSEDSRIFWNQLVHNDGDWQVVPLSYPVLMDANVGPGLVRSLKNVYRQQRRWAWGVENIPYILFGFAKNRKIRFFKKLRFAFNSLEGFWSWATNALMIFALGWLPVLLMTRPYRGYLILRNLPYVTRTIMTFAMLGIITSAVISYGILRRTKEDFHAKKGPSLFLHWILMPLTIIFFGAIPALEAQTRLMLGGRFRLGFWVTPKIRRKAHLAQVPVEIIQSGKDLAKSP